MIAELKTAVDQRSDIKSRLKKLSSVETVKLNVERAALLFRGAPIAVAVSAVNASILALVTWSDFDGPLLAIWLAAAISFAIVRAGIWLRFRALGLSGRNMVRFSRVHIVLMAVNGAIWGALAPIFFVNGLLDHAVLPFVVAGMAAGSLASASASWRCVLAFNFPALLPLAVVYAVAAGVDGLAIAGVVSLYGVVITALGVMIQLMIDRSILLQTRNSRMFKALKLQADQAHLAEQRFRALVESTNDLTLIFSPDGIVTYASPSCQQIFGVEARKLIGVATKDIVHPGDLKEFRAVGERSLSKIGAVTQLAHVCLRAAEQNNYIAFGGRITNMLYVPGVEGFVFNGGLLDETERAVLHKAV